jgi:hypothetical protein
VEVTAKLTLSKDDLPTLAAILECEETKVAVTLESYAAAALEEYVTMILGQQVFTRGSDMLEYRLFLLIKHALDNEIPNEPKVCKLFQTTTNESRALIRSVISKYQNQVQSALEQSIKQCLASAKKQNENDPFEFVVNSKTIIDGMNVELASIDGTLSQVSKVAGTVSKYRIMPSSYEKLCKRHLSEEGGN